MFMLVCWCTWVGMIGETRRTERLLLRHTSMDVQAICYVLISLSMAVAVGAAVEALNIQVLATLTLTLLMPQLYACVL